MHHAAPMRRLPRLAMWPSILPLIPPGRQPLGALIRAGFRWSRHRTRPRLPKERAVARRRTTPSRSAGRWLGYLSKGRTWLPAERADPRRRLGLGLAWFAGAAFGYQLLWVAPMGMLIGNDHDDGDRPPNAVDRHAPPSKPCACTPAPSSPTAGRSARCSLRSFGTSRSTRWLPRSCKRSPSWVAARSAAAGAADWSSFWAVVSAQLFASGSNGMKWFDRLLKVS